MAEASNKVYIVTQGEYSDYHIVTVFMDRHDAEVFCAMHNRGKYVDWDSYEILEQEVGKVEYEPDRKIGYGFTMTAHGKLYLSYNFMPKVGKGNVVPNVVKVEKEIFGSYYYDVGVMATSREQAEKIAYDLIAKYKAEKEEL